MMKSNTAPSLGEGKVKGIEFMAISKIWNVARVVKNKKTPSLD